LLKLGDGSKAIQSRYKKIAPSEEPGIRAMALGASGNFNI
jgi:hypothetical protein